MIGGDARRMNGERRDRPGSQLGAARIYLVRVRLSANQDGFARLQLNPLRRLDARDTDRDSHLSIIARHASRTKVLCKQTPMRLYNIRLYDCDRIQRHGRLSCAPGASALLARRLLANRQINYREG